MSSLKIRWIAVAAALVSLGVGLSVPASANWWGNTGAAGRCEGTGNMPQDRTVTFAHVDLQADTREAAIWVRGNLVGPTAYNTTFEAQSATTDVLIGDREYDEYCEMELGFNWANQALNNGGIIGLTTCEARAASGRCEQQVVRISNFWTQARSDYYDRNLLCHEIGHAIGLRHRENVQGQTFGCMPQIDFGVNDYSGHDKAHFTEFSGQAS